MTEMTKIDRIFQFKGKEKLHQNFDSVTSTHFPALTTINVWMERKQFFFQTEFHVLCMRNPMCESSV